MNKKTGITIAVVLAVAAVLYLIFSQKGGSTIMLPGLGTLPTSAATSLSPLTPPGQVPVSVSNAAAAAALNSAAQTVPTLCSAALTSVTPGVDGLLD